MNVQKLRSSDIFLFNLKMSPQCGLNPRLFEPWADTHGYKNVAALLLDKLEPISPAFGGYAKGIPSEGGCPIKKAVEYLEKYPTASSKN